MDDNSEKIEDTLIEQWIQSNELGYITPELQEKLRHYFFDKKFDELIEKELTTQE